MSVREGKVQSTKGREIPDQESPSLISWLKKKIDHTQGEVLDIVELAMIGLMDRESLAKVTSKIKRILQDASREMEEEMRFYQIIPMERYVYKEDKDGR